MYLRGLVINDVIFKIHELMRMAEAMRRKDTVKFAYICIFKFKFLNDLILFTVSS